MKKKQGIRLKDKYDKAVILYMEDKSYKDIALSVGVTAKTVSI